MPEVERVSPEEAVQLSTKDPIFYSHYFFPKTCRQPSPDFHRDIWAKLENPSRYVSFEIFRGAGKTSLTRISLSKRIAYGISHTILLVGKSERAAIHSVGWLAKQVMYNSLWANTYGLHTGDKWSPNIGDIEIITAEGESVRVIAYGVTGSIRGINIDDYRPDLIVGDDIADETNSMTADQREKVQDLWLGALKDSLAPRSESPLAKQILLGTPIDSGDVNELCMKDPQYDSLQISIFTEEHKSVWPERYPTAELEVEKEGAIGRNQLSLWLREMEVTMITRETAIFLPNWLKYWEVLPDNLPCILIIDPVPPPSPLQVSRNMHNKDFEVLTIMGRHLDNFFLIHYSMNRGHNPTWTIAEFWRLIDRYKPRKVVVETTAYQRTLKWLLEESMKAKRRYIQIDDNSDRRSKFDTIVDGLSGITSNGHLHVNKSHGEFIEQFQRYPKIPHDDVIETVAVGCERLQALEFLGYSEIEEDIPQLPNWRIC